MRDIRLWAVATVSLLGLNVPALAQNAEEAGVGNVDTDEIIVQARRRDEALQDVPLTVNAVSAETIEKLNIRDFKDLSSVVPGLTLNPGIRVSGAAASLRGVDIDVNSSGNNSTVEFYLNDAPQSAGAVMQMLYDIGQVEVLRGPQGTLRGRASPSGSVTVTTRRPNMHEFGGYAMGTATTLDGVNLQGAVNLPLLKDVFAVRVAGLVDNNDFNRVTSVNNPDVKPFSKTRSVRVTGRLTPLDNLEIGGSYSYLLRRFAVYDQVESACLATGTCGAGVVIRAGQRLAVENVPTVGRQEFNFYNWYAQWSFAGQRLNYVGARTKQSLFQVETLDKGNFFGDNYPGNAASATMNLQNYGNTQNVFSTLQTHELRLSSETRLLGFVDYVVGAMSYRFDRPAANVSRTVLFNGSLAPANFVGVLDVPGPRVGRTLERALFGNLTAHIGERTELSAGVRRINYKDNANGVVEFDATIWNASVKHRFNDNIMAYATAGSSWRVGSGSTPLILQFSGINLATATDPFLRTLGSITPERSKSYEIGLRTNWLDDKLTVNLSAYRQIFDNFLFSAPAPYITNFNGVTYDAPRRPGAGLAVPVPAKITGFEAELRYRPSSNFNIGATLSYAKGTISNALIPCNPPSAGPVPTIAEIQGGNPTRQVATCTVTQPASKAPRFTASVQAEYLRPISNSHEVFLRGLLDFRGNSTGEAQNPYDSIASYALLNLFAGVRAADQSWEVTAYGKNLFNTTRVLSRDSTPLTTSYTLINPSGSGLGISDYRAVALTDPREFGITARFAFGSR